MNETAFVLHPASVAGFKVNVLFAGFKVNSVDPGTRLELFFDRKPCYGIVFSYDGGRRVTSYSESKDGIFVVCEPHE